MRNDDCPCNGCVPPRRTPTCHGSCGDYIDWHNDQLKKSEQERKEKYVTSQIMAMKIETKEKARRKHNI